MVFASKNAQQTLLLNGPKNICPVDKYILLIGRKKAGLLTEWCLRCLLVKEGVVCDALHRREPDDHAHYDQKDLRVLFHRTGSVSSDKSRSIWICQILKKNALNVPVTLYRQFISLHSKLKCYNNRKEIAQESLNYDNNDEIDDYMIMLTFVSILIIIPSRWCNITCNRATY